VNFRNVCGLQPFFRDQILRIRGSNDFHHRIEDYIMKRRNFLSTAAGTLAASTVFPTFAIGKPGKSANGKLNIAFIGSGGWIARQPYEQGCSEENLVAFCDVDRPHCAENMKNWRTTQPFFDDFREMFDKMHKEIDAVVISTPDHTHFPATLAAMERGIHVYTQKPLTHNVWQARTLVKARERYKVVTQMGNQGHAGDGIRQSVEAYRAGVIGDVAEVFAHNGGPQMGGPHFANPSTMPPPSSPVPEGLDWDLWLGPAAKREFYRDYLPFKWRAFYDFGSGILADWGCHTFDTPVWTLDLDPPTVVECFDRKESLEGLVPAGSRIEYQFPANAKRGPLALHWFDGPQDWSKVGRIEKFGAEHAAHLGRACWMVGTKGMIGCGTHAGTPVIVPNDLRKEWQANPPAQTIPRVAGGPFREWLRAIKGDGPEPGSNFTYAARLTEIILLGVLAQRFNTRIEWDAKAGRITNHPELNAFVKEPARDGWQYGEDLWKPA
jgi:predicted dehydrogenase